MANVNGAGGLGAGALNNAVTRALSSAAGAVDPGSVSGGSSFGDTLKSALGDIVQTQDAANDSIGAFLRGEDVELHQVMAAAEEAGIALEMLIEVRNKIVDAYRTLTQMQG